MSYTDTLGDIVLHKPTPGTREPAAISLLNENFDRIAAHVHNATGISRVRHGLLAARGAFGTAGALYFATDTATLYADTGAAWSVQLTDASVATVTGWTLHTPTVDGLVVASGGITFTAGNTASQRLMVTSNTDTSTNTSNANIIINRTTASAHSEWLKWANSIANHDWLLGRKANDDKLYLDRWDGTTQSTMHIFDTIGNISIGNGTMQPWGTAHRSIQLGLCGAINSYGNIDRLELLSNSYDSGADAYKAVLNNPGGLLRLSGGDLGFWNAPIVAAGAAQTFLQRFQIGLNGCWGINSPTSADIGMAITQPGVALAATLTGNAIGVNIAPVVTKSGSTGTLAALNMNLSVTNNGTNTSVIATQVIGGPQGTNPGVTAYCSTLFLYNPSLSGGTIGKNNVIQHASTIAELTSAGVWVSTSHEFHLDGSRWKNREGTVWPEDSLRQLRDIPIRQFTYAQVPDPKLHLGVFAEELDAVNPMLAVDGKGVDPVTLIAFTMSAMQALLARVEALEGRL